MRKVYRGILLSGFWLGCIAMGLIYNVASAAGLPGVSGRWWVITVLVVALDGRDAGTYDGWHDAPH